jgi:AraC-like DNA-binding protein
MNALATTLLPTRAFRPGSGQAALSLVPLIRPTIARTIARTIRPTNAPTDTPTDTPTHAPWVEQPPPGTTRRPGFGACHLAVEGALRDYVSALVATERGVGTEAWSALPHDAVVLGLCLGRGSDPIEAKSERASNAVVTGFRQWTGRFLSSGDCIGLYALLTPLGVVQLLDSPRLDEQPRIRAPLAAMLDRGIARTLECDVAMAQGLEGKLRRFAGWLEARATAHRAQSRAAVRAARAAMRVCRDPHADVDVLAEEQCVSRRQLERDFGAWLGASPRHLSRIARLQGVARDLECGASLAQSAANQGFADQPHMNRVVRQLTGLTPRQLAHAPASPIGSVFRAATGGQRVYL